MEKAFILYDLEATCWRTSRPKRVEIIEVGAVKVNEDLEITSEFCAFVRPMVHPVISRFCTSLTSIRQSDVDRAPQFDGHGSPPVGALKSARPQRLPQRPRSCGRQAS